MAGKAGEAIDVAARDFIHELYDATNGYAGAWKALQADGEVQPSVARAVSVDRRSSTTTEKAALWRARASGKRYCVRAESARMRSDRNSQGRLHKVVTAPWLAVVHNEPVNEGSLTELLSYLTAGVLWAFAGLVGCMTVVPI
jgi:hypothetical protein